MNPPNGGHGDLQAFQPLSLEDRLAVAYLALPLFIFFLGWFSLPFGISLALLLLAGLWPVFRTPLQGLRLGAAWTLILASVSVALAWSALGGAGHFFYANADWPVRDAVLRDLVVSAWPPGYGAVADAEVILRNPVAYYLPAAALGKILGLHRADFLLFLWTALGVAIFLVIALSAARSARHAVIAFVVIVLFSGMDVFGVDRYFLDRPGATEHLEWWARYFQYSANTTQLFWVPNHALPAWLVAALLYRHWRNPEFLKIAPIAMAVTPLWSPLATIGLAPFGLLLVAHHFRQGTWRSAVLPLAWLGASAAFLAASYYLVLDGASIRSDWTLKVLSAPAFAHVYIKFVLLEFGLIALAVWLLRRDALILTAVAILLVLPFYMFGPGNDLAMRASIPALMILCLAAIDALAHTDWKAQPKLVLPLLVCLSFGSITAFHEIARALLYSPWAPQLDRNLIDAARGTPSHYVARLSPLLSRAMRPPQPVPGTNLSQRPRAATSKQTPRP